MRKPRVTAKEVARRAWALARYRALGGRLLTLGSDAHTPERLACGFPETARLLRELGFRDHVHHEVRQLCFTPLA